MSECLDSRFRELLHAYELGLLQGDELAAFEQHLLACEACFHEVRQFQPVSRRLLNAADIRQVVTQSVRATEKREASAHTGRRRLWLWIPLAAVALILLLLKPWHIEFTPSREAMAGEDLLLVSCFDTGTGAADLEWMSETIATLLVADLSESRFVHVVSRERVFDLLKARGVVDACPPDRETAFEIARAARARWLLSGIIVQSRPSLVLHSQLVEVASGHTIASQTISAGPSEDVFAVVDRLATEIRTELLLPTDLADETDRAVAEITTSSPEAYARYVEGLDHLLRHNPREAAEAFRAAIGHDSTFAMAYYHLAGLDDPELIYRALDCADQATRKERLFIESRAAAIRGHIELAIEKAEKIIADYPDEKAAYALLGDYYFNSGRYDRASAHYAMAIVIDSQYAHALNQLAYTHARLGDLQGALEAVDLYTAAVPNEPNPYDTRGEILAWYGRLDASIEALEQALQRQPDFCASRERLGCLYMYRGQLDKADSCLAAMVRVGPCAPAHFAGLLRACAYTRAGQFGTAMEMLDELLADDVDALPGDVWSLAITCKALMLAESGEADKAVESIEATLRSGDAYYPDLAAGFQLYYVLLVADAGDTTAAQAILDHLRTFSEQGRMQWDCYLSARGYFEFSQRRYRAASELFGQIAAELEYPSQPNYFERSWMYALALLKAGQLSQSISIFEHLLSSYTYQRTLWTVWDVKLHYYLGMAHELSGDKEQAIHQYETFLNLWRNADRQLPSVQDARGRLAHLTDAS